MKFSLENDARCAGCKKVIARGKIVLESYRDYLELKSGNAPVLFKSDGGNVVGGLLLGAAIRARKASTGIAAVKGRGSRGCASACAFAFLGGVSRVAAAREIGVHQYFSLKGQDDPDSKLFSAEDVSNKQALGGAILEFVMKMGADAGLITMASRTPPDSMYYLSWNELVALRVIYQPTRMQPWTISNSHGGIDAISLSSDKRTSLHVYCEVAGQGVLEYRENWPQTPGESVMFRDRHLLLASAFEFAGVRINKDEIRYLKNELDHRVVLDLPKNFEVSINGSLSSLSNIIDGPEDAGFVLKLNQNNMIPAIQLAMKNCRSASAKK